MTAALLQTGKHTVTALTRAGSTSTLPGGVIKVPVDYNNEDSLVAALKGHQFLIVSLAVAAGAAAEAIIMSAAGKAGVPWVMPTCYGTDIENRKLMDENLTGRGVYANIESAEKNGLAWTTMNCSFWYEFSLAQGETCYGIDIVNRKATLFGEGTSRICTSTWLQCGRAAAAFLSLKVLPEDEKDTSVTMSRWRNKPLFINSFVASQRDMLDSLHKVLGTRDADWQIEKVNAEERYNQGKALLGGPQGHAGFSRCLYTRTFDDNGDGDFRHKVVNEALGLPQEDMEEASQRAVDLAKVSRVGDYVEGHH